MKLHSVISQNRILVPLKSTSYPESLQEMINSLHRILNEEQLKLCSKILLTRENEKPSILSQNLAIPHARVDGLKDCYIVMAIAPDGIPYPDHKFAPINFIFLLLAPPTKNTFMLQMMSAISKLCHNEEYRNNLLYIKTPQRVIHFLKEIDINVKPTLNVEDIMLEEFPRLLEQSLISEAVELLSETTLSAIPVVDDTDRLLGEVSLQTILSIALPQYLGLISDHGFLGTFDPFENYFTVGRNKKAIDLMNKKCPVVSRQTPILEIAAILVEKQFGPLYVCEQKKVIGIIDTKSFLKNCLLF